MNNAIFFQKIKPSINMNVVDMLQKQFQESAENLQTVQKEYSKTLADRQTLDSQLNENKQVKEELDIAMVSDNVFKLIGPVLVKQDLDEAKGNVEKRINYISGELKRKDTQLADLDKKQDEAREKMQEVQMQMQKLRQAPN